MVDNCIICSAWQSCSLHLHWQTKGLKATAYTNDYWLVDQYVVRYKIEDHSMTLLGCFEKPWRIIDTNVMVTFNKIVSQSFRRLRGT